MSKRTSLIMILAVTALGLAMSGYLSYMNLWSTGCSQTFISCGGAKKVLIFGLPTCIYGFFMYLIVAIATIANIARPHIMGLTKTILGFSILGTAFSGFLSFYELVILKIEFSGLPACVYGLFFYVAMLVFSIIAIRKKTDIMQGQQQTGQSQ